ncbi:YgiT-type zinc finger protein [Acidobacteria bacterium ACD]|nr:MAG: YgiT-type zinc finger protein [Acidobacteriota bacterium]MCE7956748.1 YgiT-type zinc finger protein [Acidobacteria bacterium ACB2]MDL1949836.1 YgiT-type zinc finger protein [Acidobacteria bacterium ACD]
MKRTELVRSCPTCGSTTIREVVEDWIGEFRGKRYVVPGLRFSACPACGERAYSPEAMRRIEAASPAYRRPRKLRQSA